jgi:pseudouridine kinase
MVLVIGGANIDIFGYPSGEKLIKHDSNPGRVEFSTGGVGRNIAENISLLGLSVTFFGVVGDDDSGRLIIRESSEAGIDMSMVKISKEEKTSVYLCILDEHKDMDVAVCQMGITDLIDEDYIERYYEKTKKAELIVLDGNLKALQLQYILNRYQDTKVLYDPVSTSKAMNALECLGQFYCIKPNRIEAEALSGMSLLTREDFYNACQFFHDKGVELVFITCGSEGVYFSNGRDFDLLKVETIEIENVTGAGDAFAAGLAYGIVMSFDIRKMADFAVRCSKMAIISKDTINKQISAKRIMEDMENDSN